ncbi:MAG: hypothetical protein Q9216_004259 [Gyalolechia sp. 2 TL-2023]
MGVTSIKLRAVAILGYDIYFAHGCKVLVFTEWPVTQWLIERFFKTVESANHHFGPLEEYGCQACHRVHRYNLTGVRTCPERLKLSSTPEEQIEDELKKEAREQVTAEARAEAIARAKNKVVVQQIEEARTKALQDIQAKVKAEDEDEWALEQKRFQAGIYR